MDSNHFFLCHMFLRLSECWQTPLSLHALNPVLKYPGVYATNAYGDPKIQHLPPAIATRVSPSWLLGGMYELVTGLCTEWRTIKGNFW